MVINASKVDAVIAKIKKHVPDAGVVQVLVITERQFSGMETILGKLDDQIIGSHTGVLMI